MFRLLLAWNPWQMYRLFFYEYMNYFLALNFFFGFIVLFFFFTLVKISYFPVSSEQCSSSLCMLRFKKYVFLDLFQVIAHCI